jgi:hypothetical protein
MTRLGTAEALAGLVGFAEELAEADCAYGDGCPQFAGTRHGDCRPCRARRALAAFRERLPLREDARMERALGAYGDGFVEDRWEEIAGLVDTALFGPAATKEGDRGK